MAVAAPMRAQLGTGPAFDPIFTDRNQIDITTVLWDEYTK